MVADDQGGRYQSNVSGRARMSAPAFRVRAFKRALRGNAWEVSMKLPRRKFLQLAAGAAALPAVSRISRAQTYPSRPVRVIVGFPPAGGADILPRPIGQWVSEPLRAA